MMEDLGTVSFGTSDVVDQLVRQIGTLYHGEPSLLTLGLHYTGFQVAAHDQKTGWILQVQG